MVGRRVLTGTFSASPFGRFGKVASNLRDLRILLDDASKFQCPATFTFSFGTSPVSRSPGVSGLRCGSAMRPVFFPGPAPENGHLLKTIAQLHFFLRPGSTLKSTREDKFHVLPQTEAVSKQIPMCGNEVKGVLQLSRGKGGPAFGI